MKLTMNRRGEFRCNWTSTHNKCGTGPETSPKYSYYCHIETADILDPHGFVFDQLHIDQYFQERYSRYQSAKSCEKLAVTACEDIKRMIENHMLSHSGVSAIYKISVTIGLGDNGPAQMTAEWVPVAAKPIANVKKRKGRDLIETVMFSNDRFKPAEVLPPGMRGSRRLP
jgi:hypothetical protein